MSDEPKKSAAASMTQAELHTAMFAQMVMQLASTALMLMGRMPNPVTGKTETDLDAARMFIEQLEMLEVKTKGNLGAEEQHLLKQNLMTVRMAFVEAVNSAKPEAAPAVTGATPPAPETKPADEGEEASKKKFSKSYGAP
jgi:hypothetical protein